jgi:hypothetical protein
VPPELFVPKKDCQDGIMGKSYSEKKEPTGHSGVGVGQHRPAAERAAWVAEG